MKSIICLITIILFSFNSWADDAQKERKERLERMSKEDLIIMYMILEDKNKKLKAEKEARNKKNGGAGQNKPKRQAVDFYGVKDIIAAIPSERLPQNGEETISKIHERLCDEWVSRALEGKIFRGNLVYVRDHKKYVSFGSPKFSYNGLLFSRISISAEFSGSGLLQMAKEKKRFYLPVVGKIQTMRVYSTDKNENIISIELGDAYLDENNTRNKKKKREKYTAKKAPIIKSLSREIKEMPVYCFPPAGEFKMTPMNVQHANEWISKNIIGKRYHTRMQMQDIQNFKGVLLTEVKFSIRGIVFGRQHVRVVFSYEGRKGAARIKRGSRIKVEGIIKSIKIKTPENTGDPHGLNIVLRDCVLK